MDLFLQADPALQQDRATMQFVIVALLLVAALLGLLTIWYWKQTDPRKSWSSAAGTRSSAGSDRYNNDEVFLDQDDGFQHAIHSNRGVSAQHNDTQPVVSQGPNNPGPSRPADPWAATTSMDSSGSDSQ